METLCLPTSLPFLILNYMGQPRRPRTGNRAIFSLHDNGTDVNGVAEQPPSLVQAAQTATPFLPSEYQVCGVGCLGPEWPELRFFQAGVRVLELQPWFIVTVTKIHVFETLRPPCPESSQQEMSLHGHAFLCAPMSVSLSLSLGKAWHDSSSA